MKRFLLAVLACGLALGAVALSSIHNPPANPPAGNDLVIASEERNPWTHLKLNNDPRSFQFVIVSDRTGGHRPKIFSQAVEQINLLQPEFVLSVGDLIEGYTKDRDKIDKEWQEFQGYVDKLQMPFFYMPGNHDITNDEMDKDWGARFGRTYYHFVYKDVLFLMLNSEEPVGKGGTFGKEQVEYARKVLKDNQAVRWTIVAMHKPLWSEKDVEKTGWLEIERALAARKYTVFAGHRHKYFKFQRNGNDYYQLATTGGGSNLRGVKYGEFDHVVWVTMTDTGPVLANIMLDGIYPENLQKPESNEEGVPRKVKATVPVKGRVFLEGKPIPNAQVVFHYLDEKNKKVIRAGDGYVEEDGTFQLTSYKAFDGAPVGKYAVTLTWRDPFYSQTGAISPNRLPEKYASIDTSGLRVEVNEGRNEFMFELAR
jgi:3',5'-cyclic AMP phosphodiesterase CpdA